MRPTGMPSLGVTIHLGRAVWALIGIVLAGHGVGDIKRSGLVVWWVDGGVTRLRGHVRG